MIVPHEHGLHVELHVTGPFQENCYILRSPGTREFAVVDPGAGIEVRARELLQVEGERLAAILLTHAHLDHIWGLGALLGLAPATQVAMHRKEVPIYESFAEQSRLFGISSHVQAPPTIEALASQIRWLHEGERFRLGETELFVLEAPGHSPGSICFYWGDAELTLESGQPVDDGLPRLIVEPREAEGVCLVGDVVLSGSVGRTDLPGSDYASLMRSLRHRIGVLPPPTQLLGGHGQPLRLEEELRINPYLKQAIQ